MEDIVLKRANEGKCPICDKKIQDNEPIKLESYKDTDVIIHVSHHVDGRSTA